MIIDLKNDIFPYMRIYLYLNSNNHWFKMFNRFDNNWHKSYKKLNICEFTKISHNR